MEELGADPASSSSSKMDQQEQCSRTPDAVEGVVNITLPEQLRKITPAEEFVSVRHRWNTNEEIASILISFDRHKEWLILPQKIRPASGSMLLYNRKVVFYRRDGYCWKKRRNGSTIREDHMKLKVQGLECIYGSYVHSAILPTFHRRCYWLLQNPNIVLLHYLNVPYPETAKPSILSVSSELKRSEWTKEELVDQLRPMLSRVGHSSEQETDEEGKVEKILEELLPMLMPRHESNKSVAYTHNLASQPLILAPVSTATMSRSFIPRQSGQLPLIRPLASQNDQVLANEKIQQGKSQLPQQTGATSKKQLLQSQRAERSQQMPAAVSEGFHQPIVFHCHSQQNINVQTQSRGKQQQQQQIEALAKCCTIPEVKSDLMAMIEDYHIKHAATNTIHDSDTSSSTTFLQGTAAVAANQQTNSLICPQQNNSHSSQHCKDHINEQQHMSGNKQSGVSDNPFINRPLSDLQGTNNSNSILISSDVSMMNAFSTGNDAGEKAANAMVIQNQPLVHTSNSTSTSAAAQHMSSSSHSFSSLASSGGYLHGIAPPTSMAFISQSQGPVVQHQYQSQEIYRGVVKTGFQQQQQHLFNHQGRQSQQHLAQQNHSIALPIGAQHTNEHKPLVSQQQQQQQTPLLTLHLKPGVGSSSNGPGFVLSLQGATLVTPESLSTSVCSESQSPKGVAPSLNISDPSGLVLVASQNQSGELVLNRISNGRCAQPPVLSQPMTPGAPFTPHSGFSGMSCVTSSSPVSETSGMDVSAQMNATFAVASHHISDNPFQSHPVHPSSHESGNLTLNPSSQASLSTSPITLPSFLATECKLSSSNEQRPGSSTSNTLGSSAPFSTSDAKTTGFSGKDSTVLVMNSNNVRDPSSSSVKDEYSSSSFDSLFSKDHVSLQRFEAADLNKNSNKMDVCSSNGSSMYACDQTTQQQQQQQQLLQHHGQSQINNTHPLTDDLMAGPSRIQLPDKEIHQPASCDTLDSSFTSLPGAVLNLDDLLDLEEVGDIVTSPLGATDPNTPVCSWQNITSSGKACNDISDSDGCVDLLSISATAAASDGFNKSLACSNDGMHMFEFCNQQTYFHQQQLQQHQPHHYHQVSPTSPNHPGAPPRSSGLIQQPLLPPSSPSSDNSHVQSATDSELNSVIKDFSPDWAYTKSNVKVLMAGPWCCERSRYTCVFDGQHIPAALIQPGLLRCFTPFHGVGYATLQVARDGVVISNCEIFEFCQRENHNAQASHPEWFAFETKKLKFLLFERLDQLQRRLTSFRISFQDIPDDPEVMESVLVQRVKSLVSQPWSQSNAYPKAGQHNLTLLHLAAALDLAKLISCFIRWRMANSCVALDFEVDALSVDSHSCTPLMWACGLGNIDAALTLYRWNAVPLKICNKDGILPLALARRKGFYNLANQIEQLDRAKEDAEKENNHHKEETRAFNGDPPLAGNMDVSCPSPMSPGHMTVVRSPVSSSEMPVHHKAQEEEKEEVDPYPPTVTSFPKPVKPGPKLIRRFSEQVIGQSTPRTLSKRNSVDLLPSGQDVDQATLPTISSSLAPSIRETTSEPQLVVSPDMTFVAPPAPRLLLEDEIDEPSCVYTSDPLTPRMDTDDIGPVANSSPIIDVERISSDEELDQSKEDSKHQMVTLANQIIAAIPERIKLSPSKGEELDESSSGRVRSESHSSLPSQGSPRPSSFGEDSGISTPMTDSLAFDEYRYPEFGTPASSLSPDSTCLPSPYSPYSFTLDSPPPTTAEFTEYFNAPTTYMEKDFSQLTLSDQEQRKLYEAAKVIQNAYRHYRDKQQQHQKEIEAAVLIQSYYRRYKTYAYYKKMSHAAVLIQNQFRTYYAKRKKRGDSSGNVQGLRRESERLKKGRNQSVIIQQRFRSHYQRKSLDGKEGGSTSQAGGDVAESSPPPPDANSQCPEESQIVDADGDASSGHGTQTSHHISDTAGHDGCDSQANIPEMDSDTHTDLSMDQSCCDPLVDDGGDSGQCLPDKVL